MTYAVHMGLLHDLINHCALGGLFKALKSGRISFNYSGLLGIKASECSLEVQFPTVCFVFSLQNLRTISFFS
jgi:hypothetical protein